METITSAEFYRDFGLTLDRVTRGEELLVTRYGRPYVQLLPPLASVPQEDPDPPSE
jgi:antitoxin (DNA-binding transcriptional repressor) of toxin-antitoxin stability system